MASALRLVDDGYDAGTPYEAGAGVAADLAYLNETLADYIVRDVNTHILSSRWIPKRIRPTPKQMLFLGLPWREVMFGGAAGPGKSTALLMHALKWADYPDYNALILRRSYQDLAKPGAIMDMAAEWLRPTAAHWEPATHTWRFPSGATISFGYMRHENDVWNYYGPEYHCICWDELVQFSERQYRFLFSRNRRKKGSAIPLTVRSATNPPLGGAADPGWWVKDRLYNLGFPTFVEAHLDDNPNLDRDEYVASLGFLDPISLAKLLNGDWSIKASGTLMQVDWFPVVQSLPASGWLHQVRSWDCASQEPSPHNPDPDWTAGAHVAANADGSMYVTDIARGQINVAAVERLIMQRAVLDTRRTEIAFEQEPGASSVHLIDYYRRQLPGYRIEAVPASRNKVKRATLMAFLGGKGRVKIKAGAHAKPLLDEIETFPQEGPGLHDDQVDAVATGINRCFAKMKSEARPPSRAWADIWGV